MTFRLSFGFILVLTSVPFLGACRVADVHDSTSMPANAGRPHSQVTEAKVSFPGGGSSVLDMTEVTGLQTIIPRLADKRVVYVGETHDKYSHHLNQLEIIRALYERNPRIAIGMEFFQQPYQQPLDDYIAGRLNERGMLADTEWFVRWMYDYRLYRPILHFAREKGIPVIALNVPMELTRRVSKVGIEGLDKEERAAIPREIDSSDENYRERLQTVFAKHAQIESRDFNRFMQVQLTWDEGMAEQVVSYLKANPEKSMIVLAGSGHLMYGSGIPQRVSRRLPVESVIVLPGDDLRVRPGIADYLVYPKMEKLPRAGLMGVMLALGEQGVSVSGVMPDSAADRVGLEKGDLIQRLDGITMGTIADIKIGMLDKLPGDSVKLHLLRKQLIGKDQKLEFEFGLGGM